MLLALSSSTIKYEPLSIKSPIRTYALKYAYFKEKAPVFLAKRTGAFYDKVVTFFIML